MSDKKIQMGIFDPDGESDGYNRWRDEKLARYPEKASQLVVEIGNPASLSAPERAALAASIKKTNMVLYASPPQESPDEEIARQAVRCLGAGFGLNRLDDHLCTDEDAISALSVSQNGQKGRYIPYTNRPISWHTDGYYNPLDHLIRGMVLHCVRPAATGGDNGLMDPEIAYILLREDNPDHIRALLQPRVMTIPANEDAGGEVRHAQTGPVFSVQDGHLHMRYTARSRSIEWQDDGATLAAVDFLGAMFENPSPYVFRHRMTAGQGVLCNNVLHSRTGFEETDAHQRLVLRARYYDRIDLS